MVDGKLDAIADRPLSQPPVSSITIEQEDLWSAEGDFIDAHLEHADKDTPEAVWTRIPPGEHEEDHDSEDDSSDGDDGEGYYLMQCCGVHRPCKSPRLNITASTMPYVTIGDFIGTVHPWLDSVKEEIIYAKGLLDCGVSHAYEHLIVWPANLSLLCLTEGKNDEPHFQHLWEELAKHLIHKEYRRLELD